MRVAPQGAVIAGMRRLIVAPEIAARILDQFQQEQFHCNQRDFVASLKGFHSLYCDKVTVRRISL